MPRNPPRASTAYRTQPVRTSSTISSIQPRNLPAASYTSSSIRLVVPNRRQLVVESTVTEIRGLVLVLLNMAAPLMSRLLPLELRAVSEPEEQPPEPINRQWVSIMSRLTGVPHPDAAHRFIAYAELRYRGPGGAGVDSNAEEQPPPSRATHGGDCGFCAPRGGSTHIRRQWRRSQTALTLLKRFAEVCSLAYRRHVGRTVLSQV